MIRELKDIKEVQTRKDLKDENNLMIRNDMKDTGSEGFKKYMQEDFKDQRLER